MEYIIRPWRDSDAFSLRRHADDRQVWQNLRDAFPNPYTIGDAFGFIASCATESGQYIRAIEAEGEAVGSIGLVFQKDVHRYTAELGYWLGREFWGRGIMTSAVREFCDAAFESFGLVRIFAEPYEHNSASRRVLEKSGFQLEGILSKSAFKDGRHINCCMYAKTR